MHAPFARAAVAAAGCLGLALTGSDPRAVASPAPTPRAAGCACAPKPVLPVVLSPQLSSSGWTLYLRLPPLAAVSEILVRFDDRPEESTGHEHNLDVMTGKPEARTWMVVPTDWATPRDHTVAVRLAHPDGAVEGPYKLYFNPRAERLASAKSTVELGGDSVISFSEDSELYTWLEFGTLFSMRDSLSEIRYSVDDCSLRERVVFGDAAAQPAPREPESPPDMTPGRPLLSLPRSTRSACAQVVFRDGTVSRVMSAQRTPDPIPKAPPPSPPAPPATSGSHRSGKGAPATPLPVALKLSTYGEGWTMVFYTPPCALTTEFLVRVDDGPERGLGFGHELDPMTGRPEARSWLTAPDFQDPNAVHTATVRLVRLDGRIDGPYRLPFTPAAARLAEAKRRIVEGRNDFISFAEHSDTVTWLFFSDFFLIAESLREFRYSIDDCKLDGRVVLDKRAVKVAAAAHEPSGNGNDLLGPERPYLTLPRTTRSACAQAFFRDGSRSALLEVHRVAEKPRPRE
jgi:hypothetical protein